MSAYVLAFLAGLAGTYCMDQMGGFAARRGVTTGVDISHVGRWFLGMRHGVFFHADIRKATPADNEVTAGWWFHYLVGGGIVALPYPLLVWVLWGAAPGIQIVSGLLYGVVTLPMLWLVMLPAFGWGWFGKNGPDGARMLLAGVVTHLAYGVGIGLFMTLARALGLY